MIDKLKNLVSKGRVAPWADWGAAEQQFAGSGSAGLTAIYSPPSVKNSSGIRDVADMLFKMGRLDEQQLSHLRGEQLNNFYLDASDLLLKLGLAENKDIAAAKAKMHGLEFRRLDIANLSGKAAGKLDIGFMTSNRIVPLSCEEGILTVATAEPENLFVLDEVKLRSGFELNVVVAPPEDIEKAIEHIGGKDDECAVQDLLQEASDDVELVERSEDDAEDLEKMAGESPVIKFVNYLISHAIRQGASDIHIEPKDKNTKIRYRIDGVLFEEMTPPAHMHSAIVSRLKIMSNLDISERRLPQDGKIAVVVGGRGIDLRVSTLPTTYGEKVVIRVLDSKSILRGLDSSGMSEKVKKMFIEQVHKPNGILLVTGPTGSGKSTTLYSALTMMDGKRLNISTVEDPVEYELDFANQVNVNDKISMTFAAALRSSLRQDPDIIMVGEIRDGETAKIAVQAALTGHLVLSTLHTNDAVSSITRLVNIGIEPYLISSSLNGVLAQRLVRKICPNCKESYTPPENILKYIKDAGIDVPHLYHGAGCADCRKSGYLGRAGIYEMLVVDEQFKAAINKNTSSDALKSVLDKGDFCSLYQDGLQKVKDGITTIDEVLRVTEVYEEKS